MATPGQDRVERRLAAILAADVAGYSRLTGLDEEGTHAQFQQDQTMPAHRHPVR
jgi:class 3 adenylate cyclase